MFGFLLMGMPVRDACAEVIEGSSCDVEVMNVFEERAWMEGKREMEIAQTLIRKPDSVLEYSCFRQRSNELGTRGMVWSRANGLGDGWLDGVFSGLVTDSLQDLLDMIGGGAIADVLGDLLTGVVGETLSNFSADPLPLLVNEPMEDYLGRSFYHTLGGGSHDGSVDGVCDAMFMIWDFLKCSNVDENSFITFELLTTNDVRTLPRECPQTETEYVGDAAARAGHSVKWDEAITLSNPPPSLEGAANVGGMDALVLGYNADRLTPADCTPPIPTGAIVSNSPPGDYDPEIENKAGWYPDMVCSAPSCHYVPFRLGGGTPGECVP